MADDDGLTPEQEAEVRRLLANARHDEPVHADVGARLDRVLAQLAAGDPELDPAAVIELATLRRRRAASLLVAAAAIVGVGVGVGQLIGAGDGASTSATTVDAANSDQRNALPEGAAGPLVSAESAPALGAPEAAGGTMPLDAAAPLSIRSAHFTQDVERVRATRAVLRKLSYSADSGAAGPAGSSADGATAPGASPVSSWLECSPADFGAGELVPVLYDSDAAVLAFRTPTGEAQVVELLQCGTGEILRSVTLPVS